MRNQWGDEAPLLGVLGVDISTPAFYYNIHRESPEPGLPLQELHVFFLLIVIRAQLNP